LPGVALGLPPAANIDDISYGNDCPSFPILVAPCPPPVRYLYSVDRFAVGAPLSATAAQVAADGAAASDVFVSAFFLLAPPCAPMPNLLAIDGDGLLAGLPPPPGTVGLGLVEPFLPAPNLAQDNLDALDVSDPIFVDAPPWEGIQEAAVFFTLDPPSAAAAGVSPADILVSGPPYTPPGAFAVWAPAAALGLAPMDNIDALGIFLGLPGAPFPSPGTAVYFSLAPVSPALAVLPTPCGFPIGTATPGDVWGTLGGPPMLMIGAESLNLATIRSGFPNPFVGNDNLDAIDGVAEPVSPDLDLDGLSNAIDFDNDGDGLGDTPDAAAGCAPGVPDTDGDGLSDYVEVIVEGTSCILADTDADGCADSEELGPLAVLGGMRDPLEYWDFYDVTGDMFIDLTDALAILVLFGSPAPDGGPLDPLDRDIGGPGAWNTIESDTGIDLTDALANLQSFGHSCAAPP
jgi:hypothetical protein